MACITKSARLQDILDLVEALVADPDLNITDYDGVKKYFAENFPEVSEVELGQALMPLNDVKKGDIKDQLKARQDRLKKLQRSANRLNEILEKGLPKKKTRVVPDPMAAEMAEIVKTIRDLAGADIVIPENAYAEIVSRIENMAILQDAAFEYHGDDVTADRIQQIIKDKREENQAAKLRRVEDQLRRMLAGDPKETRTQRDKLPDPVVTEIRDIMKEIDRLAHPDAVIPPDQYNALLERIGKLPPFEGESISQSHLDRALEDARVIKRAAKVDQIDAKIKELDAQIKGLDEGDIRIEDIENLDVNIRFKGLDQTIAEKELELGEKRIEFDVAVAKARNKARAARGIFGIKNRVTTGTRSLYYTMMDNAWEPWRALKFMMDISAWGVQAAPLVYSMATQVKLADLARGNFAQAFASQIALGKIFQDTVFRIMADSARNMSRGARTAKSTYAQVLLNEIKSDPAYPMAQKAKLKISESGTLTSSEEMFTSNLINKVPVLGAIKDFSEDTMVSTLNAMRMFQFRQFYNATNGTASLAEYQRVAEAINRMTGTTSKHGQVASALGHFMSAPKLFISRLQLMNPKNIGMVFADAVDVPQTLKQRKFVFQTEADRFVLEQMLKSVKGYVLLTAAFAAIPGVEFEEDPKMKSFLRFRKDDLAVDATGGMGTIARTTLKGLYLARGVPKGSDIKPLYPKEGITEAYLRGFVQYKLHPTFNAGMQTISGRDFFGDSYHMVGGFWDRNGIAPLGVDGAGPHIEAMMRAFMPILMESTMDNLYDISNGNMEWSEAVNDMALNAIGASTFRYASPLADPKVVDFFKRLDYKPAMIYPEGLGIKKKSRKLEGLRTKYQDERNAALYRLLSDHDFDPAQLTEEKLKELWLPIRKTLEENFEKKYKVDLDDLEDDPKKLAKKKKKKSNPMAPKR